MQFYNLITACYCILVYLCEKQSLDLIREKNENLLQTIHLVEQQKIVAKYDMETKFCDKIRQLLIIK